MRTGGESRAFWPQHPPDGAVKLGVRGLHLRGGSILPPLPVVTAPAGAAGARSSGRLTRALIVGPRPPEPRRCHSSGVDRYGRPAALAAGLVAPRTGTSCVRPGSCWMGTSARRLLMRSKRGCRSARSRVRGIAARGEGQTRRIGLDAADGEHATPPAAQGLPRDRG